MDTVRSNTVTRQAFRIYAWQGRKVHLGVRIIRHDPVNIV